MGNHRELDDIGLRDTVRRNSPDKSPSRGKSAEPPSGPEPSAPPRTHARAGTLIAERYRLVRPLGRGGMADVWLALHEGLRADVAIKFLAPELALDPDLAPFALGRFRFEAQVSARLAGKTRHSVSVYDVGTEQGTPYLVMELVAGRDLEREVSANGPLDPRRFGAILEQVADALDVAHAMGIVHRDLKPSNILIAFEPDGSVLAKVADFGVAKATRTDSGLDLPRATASGVLVGSPAYMSPEQIDSDGNLQGTSDIWSLGVVAYEVLTGKSCFDGDSLTRVLVAVARREYVPMSEVRPALGRALDAWLARCLTVDPSQRYQTVAEMSRAYQRALADTDVEKGSAAPGPAPGPSAASSRAPSGRRAALFALALVGAMMVLVAIRWKGDSTPVEPGSTFGRPAAQAPSGSADPATPPTSAVDPNLPVASVTASATGGAHRIQATSSASHNSVSPPGAPPEKTADPAPHASAPPSVSVPSAPIPKPLPTVPVSTPPTASPSPLPTRTISPSEIH